MKEKNRHRLREALDKLPDYDPPASVWSAITRPKLPTYAPPPSVWNGVNQGLDAERSKPALRRLLTPRVWMSAAAIALLIISGVMLKNRNDGPEVTYAYSQEAMPTPVDADWNDEEASFANVRQQVQERNEPSLNNLGHELDELTSAREEVKAMLVAYGENSDVVQQLAEIERERDDVYRRIIIEL